jgi:hypothetical protein
MTGFEAADDFGCQRTERCADPDNRGTLSDNYNPTNRGIEPFTGHLPRHKRRGHQHCAHGMRTRHSTPEITGDPCAQHVGSNRQFCIQTGPGF